MVHVRDLTILIGSDTPDRLAAFYSDVLGLPRESGWKDPVFDLGGRARLRLIRHSEVQGRSLEPQRVQINLFIDDVQGESERLHAQHVRFVREPARESWGGMVATLEDPDGNYVQLLEEARGPTDRSRRT